MLNKTKLTQQSWQPTASATEISQPSAYTATVRLLPTHRAKRIVADYTGRDVRPESHAELQASTEEKLSTRRTTRQELA